MKKLFLASKRGFCSGVKNALGSVEEVLAARTAGGKVYILHEIVHNEAVVNSLKARGVLFAEEPEQAEGAETLIFSAHGVSRDVEERAAKIGCRIVDATCPIVKKLHRTAEEFEREGRRILLLGRRGHRETEGIAGRVATPVTIMEDPEEVRKFLAGLSPEEKEKTAFGCLSQTTMSENSVTEMCRLLSDGLKNIRIAANVCYATRDRQNAVRLLAENCDVILVVGSENSSNSRRLCEIAESCGKVSLLVPDPEKFDVSFLKPYRNAGITSGASAPEYLVSALVEKILKSGEFELAETDVPAGEKKGRGFRHYVPAISALLAVFLCSCCYISRRMGELPGRKEEKMYSAFPCYRDGKFHNEEPIMFHRKKMKKTGMLRFLFASENAPDHPLPQVKLKKDSFAKLPDEFSVRWLGHSSLIFELGGQRFMTDPVFGNAAPVPFAVRRYCESPLDPVDLPELDFIIISHDHYDHLEYDFIRRMRDWKGIFITSLGVGARLRSWGIPRGRIRELSWHDSVTVGDLKVTAVPARHFSGRSWSDRDRTLWAAYIIESLPQKPKNGAAGRKIFFGADSGYGKHFAEIGKKYGPFDLICLETDAWNERWPHNHMFPREMPQAFRALGGKLLLPIHWGVFDLAMHKWNESITETVRQAETHRIPAVTPLMGEKVDIASGVLPKKKWWLPGK